MNNIDWTNKRIIIVQHEADEGGPGQVLNNYFLAHKIEEILHISHPNLYIKSGYKKSSYYRIFKSGLLIRQKHAPFFHFPEYFLYLKDSIYTLYWVVSQKKKFDVFIGLGNINALGGLLLKRIGCVRKVVYYVIDYVPRRFSNRIINWIYHYFDQLAARYADATWNISPRIISGREARWNKRFPNQFVFPHGLYFDKKKILPVTKIHKNELVYMGYLNKEQGIQLILDILPKLIKRIPDIRLNIIGTGNYEQTLKSKVFKMNMDKYVIFTGLIPDINKMEERLAKGAIAFAMYKPSHSFSYFADPGKIKHYLSVGLPIIMTDLPYVAKEIEKNKCGLVIHYDKRELYQSIVQLLTNSKIYNSYRSNAMRIAKKYDWIHMITILMNRLLL